MPRPRHRKRAEAALADGEPVRADEIRLAAAKDEADDAVRMAGPNPKGVQANKRDQGQDLPPTTQSVPPTKAHPGGLL